MDESNPTTLNSSQRQLYSAMLKNPYDIAYFPFPRRRSAARTRQARYLIDAPGFIPGHEQTPRLTVCCRKRPLQLCCMSAPLRYLPDADIFLP